ncbi:3883_t:CDS:2 [Funneliformis mosseae]|uniref:3883_t:CDS:1 n=1 Tax=Funneliformis mosseae TaxID=27381 RepID=A0A9N9GP22_FUNMO|nr:3883_t:CDS:2 [Funneliformis mosseae]
MPWENKNVYFVDRAETNEKLIELICEGEYLCLSYLSESVDKFWTIVARSIRRQLANKYKIELGDTKSFKSYNIVMETFDDIMEVFSDNAEIWSYFNGGRKNIVLFFDDIDILLSSRLDKTYWSCEVEEINGEYSSWILYKIYNLGTEISNYSTFSRMIKSLMSDDA